LPTPSLDSCEVNAIAAGGSRVAEESRSVRPETVGVALIGFDYWCGVVADYLEGSCYEPQLVGPIFSRERSPIGRWRAIRRPPLSSARIVHAVNALTSRRLLAAFRVQRCAIVLHWIGSDYRRLARMSTLGRRTNLSFLRFLDATHLIDSPELQEDLAPFGVHGDLLRLVPRIADASIEPLPVRPAALSYWSDERADFYGRSIVYGLARRQPDVPFRVVGPSTRDPAAPRNVEFLGFQRDMRPIYRECSVLIRVIPHDSISAMVLEAMARGRDVIYSRPFPHTRYATDEATAAAALADHLAEYQPNAAGVQYVRAHFAPQVWSEALKQIYARVLGVAGGRAE